LQKKLDAAEAEKNKYKSEAEMEHERAEVQSKRATEEEGKRVEVEARLQMTLDELRAESRLAASRGGPQAQTEHDARCGST